MNERVTRSVQRRQSRLTRIYDPNPPAPAAEQPADLVNRALNPGQEAAEQAKETAQLPAEPSETPTEADFTPVKAESATGLTLRDLADAVGEAIRGRVPWENAPIAVVGADGTVRSLHFGGKPRNIVAGGVINAQVNIIPGAGGPGGPPPGVSPAVLAQIATQRQGITRHR